MVPKNPTAYQRLMLKIANLLPGKSRAFFLHPAGKQQNPTYHDALTIYQRSLVTIDKTGPTTIFFWAPTFKWGLVLAGIGDINRPLDKISLGQTASLMMTGFIWTRYSLVITPVNYNLMSVNLFVGLTNLYNFARAANYQWGQQPKE